MDIRRIVQKSLENGELSAEEIAQLYSVSPLSEDGVLVMAAARQKSERASGGLAEVHAQVGLNAAPCPNNCLFCSFAAVNDVFNEATELPVPDAVARTLEFERDGANAIFIMSTADYPFGKFIETSQEIRRVLSPETILIANVGDFSLAQARKLKEAGFTGVYHALRLGEGRDTAIDPQRRLETFRYAREVGLVLGTCLEPVGNEHSIEELVEKTIITREAKPAYSGAARRIPIPGTALCRHGIVSELRMAYIVAVVRLAVGYDIPGNCTHEPNVIGAAWGANLFWAEVGSNPRDTQGETEGRRGMSVPDCRRLFAEAQWNVLQGPSRFYSVGIRDQRPEEAARAL